MLAFMRQASFDARRQSTQRELAQDESGLLMPVQNRRGGGGPTRLPGGGMGELTPAQVFLLSRYQAAMANLSGLEPYNPYLQTMRPQNTPPSLREVERIEAELNAARLRMQSHDAPRGSPLPGPAVRRQDFKDWDKPSPEREAAEARAAGRTEAEYVDLAKDPDHGGRVGSKSVRERRIALDLEQRGDLAGPVVRDTRRSGGEIVDAAGKVWDIKGPNSYVRGNGAFDRNATVEAILDEVAKGENVIIDTSKMKPENVDEVRQEISRLGLSANVRWWP